MKIVFILVLWVIPTLSMLCQNVNNVSPQAQTTFELDDTIKIAYQDTVINYAENISLSFNTLVSDSRCPNGVTCVWAGDAEIILSFSMDGDIVEFNLHTHTNFQADTVILGYNIQLIGVEPYPHIDSTFAVNIYKAFVKVTK